MDFSGGLCGCALYNSNALVFEWACVFVLLWRGSSYRKNCQVGIKPSIARALPLLRWAVCRLSSQPPSDHLLLSHWGCLGQGNYPVKEAAGLRGGCPDDQEAREHRPGLIWAVSQRNCLSPAQEVPPQAGACSCHRLEQRCLEEEEEREPALCWRVGRGRSHFPLGHRRGVLQAMGCKMGLCSLKFQQFRDWALRINLVNLSCCPFLPQKTSLYTPLGTWKLSFFEGHLGPYRFCWKGKHSFWQISQIKIKHQCGNIISENCFLVKKGYGPN